MKPVIGVVALILLIPVVAAAQSGQTASVTAGSRVRITAANFGLDKHVTTVTELRGDSVVVGVKGRPLAVALRDVSALDVSAGRRKRVLPYALVGLGVGAIGGYAIGYASYDEGSFLSNSRSDEGTWAGATLGVIGLFTGAIAGAFHRGDHWVPAQPLVRASIDTTPSGGMSFGISRAF